MFSAFVHCRNSEYWRNTSLPVFGSGFHIRISEKQLTWNLFLCKLTCPLSGVVVPDFYLQRDLCGYVWKRSMQMWLNWFLMRELQTVQMKGVRHWLVCLLRLNLLRGSSHVYSWWRCEDHCRWSWRHWLSGVAFRCPENESHNSRPVCAWIHNEQHTFWKQSGKQPQHRTSKKRKHKRKMSYFWSLVCSLFVGEGVSACCTEDVMLVFDGGVNIRTGGFSGSGAPSFFLSEVTFLRKGEILFSRQMTNLGKSFMMSHCFCFSHVWICLDKPFRPFAGSRIFRLGFLCWTCDMHSWWGCADKDGCFQNWLFSFPWNCYIHCGRWCEHEGWRVSSIPAEIYMHEQQFSLVWKWTQFKTLKQCIESGGITKKTPKQFVKLEKWENKTLKGIIQLVYFSAGLKKWMKLVRERPKTLQLLRFWILPGRTNKQTKNRSSATEKKKLSRLCRHCFDSFKLQTVFFFFFFVFLLVPFVWSCWRRGQVWQKFWLRRRIWQRRTGGARVSGRENEIENTPVIQTWCWIILTNINSPCSLAQFRNIPKFCS